jgi:dynein heavy chain
LEGYLEEKRSSFARFYFISNEELLEILANAARLVVIEKFMGKCFENVGLFMLGDDDNEDDTAVLKREDLSDIFGAISNEGEKLELLKVLKVRAQGVEIWLKHFEEAIYLAVNKNIKEGYESYYGEEGREVERKKWVMTPSLKAQSVNVVCLITWTEATEIAIGDLPVEPAALTDLVTNLIAQLSDLTELIRSELTIIQRRMMVALITQDVHGRDIVQQLIDQKI